MAYNAERTVIEQLAKQGSCVIIGRCASAILPKEDRLSVFIYADKADKIKRVMARNNLTEKEADHRIKHMDRMRKQFFDFIPTPPGVTQTAMTCCYPAAALVRTDASI